MMSRQSEELDLKIDAGIKQAISEALEEHRRMGRSVVVWKDGKVVTIPPSEIPIRNEEPSDRAA
jgi:hypothetical protein